MTLAFRAVAEVRLSSQQVSWAAGEDPADCPGNSRERYEFWFHVNDSNHLVVWLG